MFMHHPAQPSTSSAVAQPSTSSAVAGNTDDDNGIPAYVSPLKKVAAKADEDDGESLATPQEVPVS